MNEPDSASIDEELVAEVRDALAHYYDQAHLLCHPLLRRLQATLGPDPTVAVQELRRLLARAIQSLRPRSDTPLSDAAWRPYAVLHRRYILAKELADLERELALGRRQLMREQRRGLAAIASSLAQQGARSSEGHADAAGDSPLLQEISRVASTREGVDVRTVLDGSTAAAAALARAYRVQLTYTRPDAPAYVVCKPSLLRQLLVAALSFAIRAGAGGDATVTVSAGHGRTVVSIVRSHDQAERVEPPTELPESIAILAEAQGVEAGLSAGAGRLGLDITLPAAGREQVVALVEDNEDVVQLFARCLAGRGYRLLSLRDSTEAIERIAEANPDVVVLDVMMSEVDGWEILQRLKASPALRHIPVAVCSVLDEPELAAALGAEAYLRKPVRSAQLLDCLSELLSRRM